MTAAACSSNIAGVASTLGQRMLTVGVTTFNKRGLDVLKITAISSLKSQSMYVLQKKKETVLFNNYNYLITPDYLVVLVM